MPKLDDRLWRLKGDHEVFTELHSELEPPVRRFVCRLVGRYESEDEIVQDAFMKLYSKRNRQGCGSNAGAWSACGLHGRAQ